MPVNKNLDLETLCSHNNLVPRRTLLLFTALFLLSCAIYFDWSFMVTEPGYPLDDAWIHQVFARNLATGHGFSFNPDIPIAGATAPLWTLLLAVIWPLLGPVASGLIMGALLTWLALIGTYKVATILTGDEKLSRLLLFGCAICWPLIWNALSGMEVGLYSSLSLWGLYFYLKAESFDSRLNYLSYLLFSLAILARPECALFWVAAAVRDFWEWLRSPKKSLSPWLWRFLILGVLMAPYFIFNYSTTGTLFPQTYIAKSQGKGFLSALINGDLKHLLKSIFAYPYFYLQDFLVNLIYLSPLLFLAAMSGMLKMISIDDRLKSKRIMLVLFGLLYVPIMGAIAPVLNATYQSMRLIANLIPISFLFGLAGLFWTVQSRYGKITLLVGAALGFLGGLLILLDKLIAGFGARYLVQDNSHFSISDYTNLAGVVRNTGVNIIILGAVVAFAFLLSLEIAQKALTARWLRISLVVVIIAALFIPLILYGQQYALNVEGVNAMDRAIGRRLHGLGHGEVATGDIGAIAYYSGMKVFDLRGLVSPELPLNAVFNDSLSFDYMLKHNRVDYVAIYPEHFGYIAGRTDILNAIGIYMVGETADARDRAIILYRTNWPDSATNNQPLHIPQKP
ncbi:MAG TPA: hypothetical protein DEO84_08140 [candidate division Zixibacteria bacterium]|nr:hypothetical protein [candidate division Zixibacteria bacterium]HBZ01270.1 hypothetical protein [candidate division Zixibacteria bacterium]